MEARGMDTRIQEWGHARSQELQTYHGVTGLWQYLRTTSEQTDIWIYRPNIESCPDRLQKEQWIWEYNPKACRELVEACRKKRPRLKESCGSFVVRYEQDLWLSLVSSPDRKSRRLSVFKEGPKFGAILFLTAEQRGKIVKGLMSEEAVPTDLHLDPYCGMFFRMI